MGETHHHRQQATTSSRLGMRAAAGGGEIVEVQGGHIVRSTGRKDRHSKVCTAKGPRDRRVRLSAHTAIQFYDVQDRLGYDRPSKAVDWLIKKAKAAIDELAELPAWKPTATTTASNSNVVIQQQKLHEEEENHQLNQIVHREPTVDDARVASGSRRATAAATMVGGCCGGGRFLEFQQQHLSDGNGNSSKYNSGGSAFLPPTMDADIADTIKSFFPMVAAAEVATTSSFQNYPPPPDLLSRTTSGASNHSHQHHHHHQQDLRLSLQSFQDPSILLHQQQQQQQQPHHHVHEQVLFAGTTALGFDSGSPGWSEQQHQQEEQEHGRLQRMVAWNNAAAADAGSSGHGCGLIFNSPAAAVMPSPAMFGHGQFFSQRGPLQSSNTPSLRAWIDPSSIAAAAVTVDHHHPHHHYLSPAVIHQASIGLAGSSSGGFSGFRVPARIQGEEEHDGVSDKPSSASSDSRH